MKIISNVIAAAAIGLSTAASAQVSVNVDLGSLLFGAPPPVIVAPPAYYGPPPVVYRGRGNWGHEYHRPPPPPPRRFERPGRGPADHRR